MKKYGLLLMAVAFLMAVCVVDAAPKKKVKERIDLNQEFPKEEVVTFGEFHFKSEGKYDVVSEEFYRGLRLWTIPISDDMLKQCPKVPKGTPKDWDMKRVKISCSLGLKNVLEAWEVTAVHSIKEITLSKERKTAGAGNR